MFREGPVFANILLADEINRATPRTQSALLECMEEHQVTVDGENFVLEEPFVVIATQNPVETAGTYRLPEAQLDRFLMKINMGYPDKKEEKDILTRYLMESPIENIESVCNAKTIVEMKKEAKNVYIHESLIEYIAALAEKTRNHSNVLIGVSPRGSISMVNVARAYAYVLGRDYVIPEDINTLAVYVWAHRIVLQMGSTRQDNRDQIIENVLSSVEVPTEEWTK